MKPIKITKAALLRQIRFKNEQLEEQSTKIVELEKGYDQVVEERRAALRQFEEASADRSRLANEVTRLSRSYTAPASETLVNSLNDKIAREQRRAESAEQRATTYHRQFAGAARTIEQQTREIANLTRANAALLGAARVERTGPRDVFSDRPFIIGDMRPQDEVTIRRLQEENTDLHGRLNAAEQRLGQRSYLLDTDFTSLAKLAAIKKILA